MRRFMGVAVLMSMGACAQPAADTAEKSSADVAADVAALAQVRDAWSNAFKAGDAAALAALYTADAHAMTNHMPTAVGAQAVQEGYTGFFQQMTATEVQLTTEKVEVAGDMAYDRGTFKFTMTPKAGGAAVIDSGRYIVVLRRQADGSWKLAEAIGNSADPLPAPAPAR